MWLDGISVSAVSADSVAPLHSQLSGILRAAIADGSLPPGAHLPTEAQLQEKFGISRSVVRQSMTGLAAEGLIQRGRGRGSVVAPHREHHRQVQRMPGLSAQISSPSSPVTTEVLALDSGTDPRAEAALGTGELLALRRRRCTEDEAIAIIQTWLPRALVGGLTAEELTDASLHTTLAERYGIPVTAGRRQIRAVPASEQLAKELALPVGAPLLLLEGTSVDDQGEPVEYFSTWHRADVVVFDIEAGPGSVVRAAKGHDSASPPGTAELAARVEELARQLQELSELLR